MTGWAVGSDQIPAHGAATVYARALARLGVNCVRLHFIDMPDSIAPIRNEGAARGRGGAVHPPPARADPRRLPDTGISTPSGSTGSISGSPSSGRTVSTSTSTSMSDAASRRGRRSRRRSDRAVQGVHLFRPRADRAAEGLCAQAAGPHQPLYRPALRRRSGGMTVEVVNENSLLEFWMRNWLRGGACRAARMPSSTRPRITRRC
ncbi:hypothetical protein DdX_21726 [Ditylenchus destructor]|uniref:Uncharacterized protein n=1 Tax=Ditylenchus destructor TaxID=166010 RepID=A0AAD4QSW6_9BILA|nr:hypothetical protein DdX_21726 [Ditylenchus destructor]